MDNEQVFSQIEGELKTRFELLPTELQQVILSSDYQMKLFELAKKYKLTYEKLGQLELETTMVLLGMTPPDEFKADLFEELKIDETTIDNIVKDLNEQIFSPIRTALMGIYTKEEVEIGEKFANTVQNTVPAESPYREPITKKESSINTNRVPTLDKNEYDVKNEAVLNPLTIGLSENPITPINQTPLITKNPDPYREVPETAADIPGITLPKNTVGDVSSLVKDIPTLKIETTAPLTLNTKSLEMNRSMGGIQTMNTNPTVKNQSDTLHDIELMKKTLRGEVKEEVSANPIVSKEEIVIPEKPSSLVSSSLPTQNEAIRPSEVQNTFSKIDSLIDSKKAEAFFVSTPPVAVPQNHIYDKSLVGFDTQVKKTGFFAKIKNFLGKPPVQIPENTSTQNPTPVPMAPLSQSSVETSSMSVSGPVNDSDVDNVKIFDEVDVTK